MLNEKEMNQILKANKVSDTFLKGVNLVGTDKEAPLLLVKTAIVPYLELFDGKIKSIGNYKHDYVDVKIIQEAEVAAEQLDRESLGNLLETIATSFGGKWYIPYGRYANGAQISRLIAQMKAWEKWNEYGVTGRRNIVVVRGALLLSDTREAILKLDKDGILYKYANIRQTSENMIRDQVLFDFGFDENGHIEYDLGGKQLLVMLEQNFTLSYFDKTAQKIVKSVPKKDVDPVLAEQVAKELADIKKNLKKVVRQRTNDHFGHFMSGYELWGDTWKKNYMFNPVLKLIARTIVWKQGGTNFILRESGAIDCDGNLYSVQSNKTITVAHPMEMTQEEVTKWQTYITEQKIEQPFIQMWEVVVEESEITPERYIGKMIPYYKFLNKEEHGIVVLDRNYHDTITIYLSDCNAEIERKNWRRHDIDMNDVFEIKHISFDSYTRRANHVIAYLDTVTKPL